MVMELMLDVRLCDGCNFHATGTAFVEVVSGVNLLLFSFMIRFSSSLWLLVCIMVGSIMF